jgi:hypothetical protein
MGRCVHVTRHALKAGSVSRRQIFWLAARARLARPPAARRRRAPPCKKFEKKWFSEVVSGSLMRPKPCKKQVKSSEQLFSSRTIQESQCKGFHRYFLRACRVRQTRGSSKTSHRSTGHGPTAMRGGERLRACWINRRAARDYLVATTPCNSLAAPPAPTPISTRPSRIPRLHGHPNLPIDTHSRRSLCNS